MANPDSEPGHRRVLVTGAGGFTGRHLCAHLREHGFRVFGLTEHAPQAEGEIQANLDDGGAIDTAVRAAAPDYVVHLAAIAFPGHARAADFYRVNLAGTLTLLEALAAQGVAQGGVLLPSTATVYAPSTQPLTEDSPVEPLTHYAVSKLAMEKMARLFANRLPIAIVRPFNYTGPGQREPYVIPKIVRHFKERAPAIELGNVDVEREFLDVRVVVDGYRRLLDAPQARGGVFNLCSGTGTTVRAIVEQLERITGHRIEIRVNPQLVRHGEPPRIVGSPARLRAAIGELLSIPLETTLADML
ncbi:MAG: NAD-dependent epimerase/dehydratase family protein [Burkholderiales bacterium]|nr:NAD-dependent epimerase/dehydratase family protein [Burkholderiales bacterium]